MNRIDRISAILIQLQGRRVVKAQEIADRFGISLRTVYRDIKSLEEAGVPLIGEAGVGYSLVEGYRLPPVMFTREEATAFLTAEKLVSQLTDDSTSADYSSAMFKIKAVLKSSEKDFLEEIDSRIAVFKTYQQQHKPLKLNPLQVLIKSIAQKRAVTINYFALYKQQTSERVVEPVGVFFLDNHWHLIAFCRLRNNYRDFRLDRISTISVTGESFSQEHPTLKHYLEKNMPDERNLFEVLIRVSKKAHSFLDGQKYYNGFISEQDLGDQVEMSFLTCSIEGFARWYLMFADEAFIIKPEALQTRVLSIISTVQRRLNSVEPLLEGAG